MMGKDPRTARITVDGREISVCFYLFVDTEGLSVENAEVSDETIEDHLSGWDHVLMGCPRLSDWLRGWQ